MFPGSDIAPLGAGPTFPVNDNAVSMTALATPSLVIIVRMQAVTDLEKKHEPS